MIGAFYTLGTDVFSSTEDIWEGEPYIHHATLDLPINLFLQALLASLPL